MAAKSEDGYQKLTQAEERTYGAVEGEDDKKVK